MAGPSSRMIRCDSVCKRTQLLPFPIRDGEKRAHINQPYTIGRWTFCKSPTNIHRLRTKMLAMGRWCMRTEWDASIYHCECRRRFVCVLVCTTSTRGWKERLNKRSRVRLQAGLCAIFYGNRDVNGCLCCSAFFKLEGGEGGFSAYNPTWRC